MDHSVINYAAGEFTTRNVIGTKEIIPPTYEDREKKKNAFVVKNDDRT